MDQDQDQSQRLPRIGEGVGQGRPGSGAASPWQSAWRSPTAARYSVTHGGQRGNEEPHRRVLHPIEGVVRTHREDTRWWTWPLPPSGRLDFICQLGEAERRVSVDAQLILDASQRSTPAWPDV